MIFNILELVLVPMSMVKMQALILKPTSLRMLLSCSKLASDDFNLSAFQACGYCVLMTQGDGLFDLLNIIQKMNVDVGTYSFLL